MTIHKADPPFRKRGDRLLILRSCCNSDKADEFPPKEAGLSYEGLSEYRCSRGRGWKETQGPARKKIISYEEILVGKDLESEIRR